jgi:flagellar hook-length control protein FliK
MADAAPTTQAAIAGVEAAPTPGLKSQGQGAAAQGAANSATNSATGEAGSSTPQIAQTTSAGPNNEKAGGSGTPGGLSAEAPVSEAGAQNRLAQNARTDTAQTPGAAVADADDAANSSRNTRPAALASTHNNATQTARADGSAQAGTAALTAAQNAAPSGTAATGERAIAPGSAQRAEGAGQANANIPTAAGVPGLTQAATRIPQILPAQARPATASSVPVNQVAVNIQRAVAAGQDRIRISLHPAELGKIDVKLDIGNDGAVKAVITIERPETFELLQRDARGLEKALQEAGLKTDSGSLSFNLKGESEQDATARREGADTDSQEAGAETPADPELAPEVIAAANANGTEHALDIHV